MSGKSSSNNKPFQFQLAREISNHRISQFMDKDTHKFQFRWYHKHFFSISIAYSTEWPSRAGWDGFLGLSCLSIVIYFIGPKNSIFPNHPVVSVTLLGTRWVKFHFRLNFHHLHILLYSMRVFFFLKSFSNVNKTENWLINVRNILTENVNAIHKSLLESKCGHKYRIFSHDCSVMLAAFSSDKIDGIFKQTRHTHTCDYKQFHFCRFNHHKCIFQTLFICFGISISEKWSYNAAQNTKYTQQTHKNNKKKTHTFRMTWCNVNDTGKFKRMWIERYSVWLLWKKSER